MWKRWKRKSVVVQQSVLKWAKARCYNVNNCYCSSQPNFYASTNMRKKRNCTVLIADYSSRTNRITLTAKQYAAAVIHCDFIAIWSVRRPRRRRCLPVWTLNDEVNQPDDDDTSRFAPLLLAGKIGVDSLCQCLYRRGRCATAASNEN